MSGNIKLKKKIEVGLKLGNGKFANIGKMLILHRASWIGGICIIP